MDRPLSSTMLVSMRKAAALAFAVPGLEVDVRCAGELVATTGLCPGAFRAAVGRLVNGRGEQSALLGPHAATDVHIDLFMPFTGAAGPFGMVVARLGEIIVHVFATTRPPSEAMVVVADVGCHPSITVSVNASWDEVTQITLVHAESRICDVTAARPHIEAMMNAAFLRLAVDEITAAVAASATENRQDQP
jgi:hypothetical protein